MNNVKVFACKGREVLHQALQALALHRLRSILSALGIVFAVAAVVTMLAIAEGAKRETLDQIGRLGIDSIIIRPIEEANSLPVTVFTHAPGGLVDQDVAAIRQIPGVERITFVREFRSFFAELGESDVITTLGVNHDYLDARGLILANGRFVSATDVQNRHQVCVLGGTLARRLGIDGGKGVTIHVDGDPYRVVGVLKRRGSIDNEALPLALRDFDNTAFIPLEGPAQASAFGGENDYFSEIILKVSNAGSVEPVSRAVRRILLRNRDGVENFELVIPKELLSQARQAQQLFNIVLGSIAGISLLVGGIGIMNIMLANVSERTREIGIRRAVGASRQHIVVHFLGESILLTVIGGLFGVVIGSFAALGVNFFIDWRASITLWPVLSALFMSIAVGLVSGIYPAVKAADMDPVEALRHI